MRTFKLLAATLWVASLGAGAAYALDAAPRPQPLNPALSPALAPATKYGSVRDALRSGMRDYNAGDKLGAVQALEYAAGQGHQLALWKLGRMYADGDGVAHDDLKAFEYFSRLADQHADESPDSPNAAVVSSAFVALGGYFLDGIKDTYVMANPERAVEMFSYAASYFSDSNAQYNLARLYLEGTGVKKDSRHAARWFNLAAEKGHHRFSGAPRPSAHDRAGRSAPARQGSHVADACARGLDRCFQGPLDRVALRRCLHGGRRERPQARARPAGAVHPVAPVRRA